MPAALRPFVLLLAGVSAVTAQPLTFEVASVKPSPPGAHTDIQVTGGGGLNATATLDFLIVLAYKIKPFQLLDAPGWTRSEQYTISARPAAGTAVKRPGQADDDLLQRLQALLVDRFGLVARRETRELPAYVLTVAKNGPKLAAPDPQEKFKLRLGRGKIANDGGGTIAMLVSLLENQLDRRVFDETGLTGRYKFDITYAPRVSADPTRPPDDALPSLFTALQEQAGLKLESRKRPVEAVVVERVARPTPD